MDTRARGSDSVRDPVLERTAARWFLLLVILYLGFIAAATLSVGTGEFSLAKGADELDVLLRARNTQVETVHDLRDIATNLLLFLPLGTLVALRLGPARIRAWSPWLLLGPAASVCLELVQAFTDRSADPVDVLTNTGGHVIGYVVGLVAIRRFGFRPEVLLGLSGAHHDEKRRTVAGLLFLYVCVYVVIQLVPFDVSVSLSRIHAKLVAAGEDAPRIILDPLLHVRQGSAGVLELFYAAMGVIPAAALVAHLDALRGRRRLVRTLWFATVLATTVEAAQIFILSRTVDIAYVLLAPAGAILGWGLAWAWLRIQGEHGAGRARHAREPAYALGLGVLVYVAFLGALAMAPYDLETDVAVVIRKLREETNWVPFRVHFDLHSMVAARDLIEETGQLAPLGLLIVLLARALRRQPPPEAGRERAASHGGGPWRRSVEVILAGGACALLGLCLEIGQAFCVGRFVDLTDVLLAGLGGLIGAALVRVLAGGAGGPNMAQG